MDTIKDKQRLDALAEHGHALPGGRAGSTAGASTARWSASRSRAPSTRSAASSPSAAHADDIEIGCGATMLARQRTLPTSRSTGSCSAQKASASDEARASAEAFLATAARADVEVHGFRDGFFPYVGGEVKDVFEELKGRVEPDLIFTHARHDLHQDHRLVCELTWNTWRDHLILEYEIPKYDGDLGTPNVFVPVPDELVAREGVADRGVVREPAREALVRRGALPRPDAPARDGGALAERATRRRSRVASSSPGSGEPDVRVLVTGHHGYIGSVHRAVAARRRATTSSGSTRSTTAAATSGPSARRRVARWRSTSATSARTSSRASTRSSIWPRSRTTRSATSTPPGRTPSTSTARSRSRAPRGRRGVGGSSSRRRARCTAPRRATTCSTRSAPLQSADAVRRVEGARGGGAARARRRRLLARRDAERDRLRRLAAAPARRRAQQPRGLGAHDRARSASSATGRRGGRSCTSSDIARATLRSARGAARGGARRGVQHRLRGAELPHPRARRDRCTACSLRGRDRAPDASPDPRSYRVDFSKLRSAFPGFRCEWTAERGAEELVDRVRGRRPQLRAVHGRRSGTRGSRSSSACSRSARLDDTLRWRDR